MRSDTGQQGENEANEAHIEWVPILILPNLDMTTTLESQYATIVPPTDRRVQELCADHPNLAKLLWKFLGQFGERVRPSLLLMRSDTPNSYYNTEGITAFRDILSLSVVPYARATRLCVGRSAASIYTNAFQFYPWMVDRNTDEVISSNSAQLHIHELVKFFGQSFPEQPRVSITRSDIDQPLVAELLNRWFVRFASGTPEWKDRALFRSLNMANEAARIPASTATVFYDVGRSLALWVSAYEILVHPGGKGRSGSAAVCAMLERVKWHRKKLTESTYVIGRKSEKKPLATWICKRIYDLRNDFLHGNEVRPSDLTLNNQPIIDFAGCLYRLVLTAFLDIEVHPPLEDADSDSQYFRSRMGVHRFQLRYEDALLKAIASRFSP